MRVTQGKGGGRSSLRSVYQMNILFNTMPNNAHLSLGVNVETIQLYK